MDVRSVLSRDVIPNIDDPVVAPGYFGDPSDDVVARIEVAMFVAAGHDHCLERVAGMDLQVVDEVLESVHTAC